MGLSWVPYFFLIILNNTDVQFFPNGQIWRVSIQTMHNVYAKYWVNTELSVKINRVLKIFIRSKALACGNSGATFFNLNAK